MALFEYIYLFFLEKIFPVGYVSGELDALNDAFVFMRNDSAITIWEYLSFVCSIISIVFILVLCCLFVYKIVRLIGGLIR